MFELFVDTPTFLTKITRFYGISKILISTKSYPKDYINFISWREQRI